MNRTVLSLGLICLIACRSEHKNIIAHQQSADQKGGNERVSISNLSDTGAINRLINQGYRIHKENTDSAIYYYTEALQQSLKIGYTEGVAVSSNNLASQYKSKKNYIKVEYYQTLFKSELNKIPSRFYNPKMARHNWLIHYQGFEKARAHYEAGDFDTAATLYLKTLTKLGTDNSVNYALIAWANAALGAIYHQISDNSRALRYFDRMWALGKKYADSTIMVQALTNKATLFENSQRPKKALPSARQALALAKKINDLEMEGHNTHIIAHALINLEQPEEALTYSKRRLKISQHISSETAIQQAYELLGYNYNQLKEHKKAEVLLESALDIALSTNHLVNVHGTYEQLAEAYEGQGDYAQALKYHKKYAKIRDSLRSTENVKRISETETRYQVAQKDKKLAQQELRIERQQKNLYLWIGGGLLLIVILIGLLWRKQHKSVIAKLKARLAGEEQERARMARELHDGVVSRLSVIKTHFSALPQYYRGDKEADALQDAVRQLDQSITELRSTSHNLLPDVLKRSGLVEGIRDYCEKVSQIYVLNVRFQLVGKLPILTDNFQLNVYRIIQELLQNILKHARASRALVQFNIQEDQLDITVEDNGPEQQNASADKPDQKPFHERGIGWLNLKDRVKLLEGQIDIEQDKATSVYISFDLKKHKLR